MLIVYNPTAGKASLHKLNQVVSELSKLGVTPQLYASQYQGDICHNVADKLHGIDMVVAAGGDGTINEVINAIIGKPVKLGIIPLGTTNVLAIELNLPHSAKQLANVLVYGQSKTMYVGQQNGTYFALMVGVGYDARVVEHVNTAIKRRFGKLAYVLSMVKQLLQYGNSQYTVTIDGAEYITYSAVITLAKHYGGSFVIAKQADLYTPSFEVVLINTRSKWSFLLMLLLMPLRLAERLPFVRIITASYITVNRRILHALPISGISSDVEATQMDGDSRGALPAIIQIDTQGILIVS